ncbi:NAD-binding protein [Pleionea sp. CnH1-48]|uniref:NAD-binding protein n=1 Tax=Pleionea sp. CnH1-48 TaxID=2954494 RepID=UPI0020969F11|nr:NAD-binding protein [Pleionea sp. CnH1-48]MCO7224072.1 NAD-binding protein [Pleionea sp. CnH1-48]
MNIKFLKKKHHIGWKWWIAILVFIAGFAGFYLGVEVSERPGVATSDVFTKAYYTLGLFVLGGMDLGTPTEGPLLGKILLWFAYFAAPILTASALIDTLVNLLAPDSWGLRRLRNHVIVIGNSELTPIYLKNFRQRDASTPIIVVVRDAETAEIAELQSLYQVRVIVANATHDFVLSRLRVEHAKRILLFSKADFVNYETASNILTSYPDVAGKVIVHVSDLRFMRVMKNSLVDKKSTTFNQYHMSAAQLVKAELLRHFLKTKPKDVVVFAGFGRFGQSILEELQENAVEAFERIIIMDKDAQRRVLVADEQSAGKSWYQRDVVEGDVRDPKAWQTILNLPALRIEEPVFILGTGDDAQNLRTAVWLHQHYPKALIIARTQTPSLFAKDVCLQHEIVNISLTELVELGMPEHWYQKPS